MPSCLPILINLVNMLLKGTEKGISCDFLDIIKRLKEYSTETKLKSVDMVLEACESMDASNIRY